MRQVCLRLAALWDPVLLLRFLLLLLVEKCCTIDSVSLRRQVPTNGIGLEVGQALGPLIFSSASIYLISASFSFPVSE